MAVITGVVFWTGLPFAVGAGAIALGLSGTGGRAKAGLGLGLLAIVASFVLLLVG